MLALSLSVGLAFCLLGGEGHFLFSETDWLTRDAVLADLVRSGTTVLYHYDVQNYVLYAPLGMYLLPSAVGRLYGFFAAHINLLGQNTVIFGVIFYLVAGLGGLRALPFILFLIGVGGLDMRGVSAAEARWLAFGEGLKADGPNNMG